MKENARYKSILAARDYLKDKKPKKSKYWDSLFTKAMAELKFMADKTKH